MRVFLFFLCFILSSSACFAREGKSLTDSLKLELKHHTSPDTVRVLVLTELANAVYYSYPDEAKQYAAEALDIARDLKWNKGVALALREIGNVYYNSSDFLSATNYFHDALLAAESVQDKILIISLYNNLANINADLEYFDEALTYYRKCLRISREQQYTRYEMIALTNIGTVYFEQGELDLALNYYFKSLELAEELKEDRSIAAVLNNIGNIYRKKGDYAPALSYLNRSQDIAREIDNLYIIALSLNNLGKVNLQLSKLQEAEEQAHQALAIAREINMREWQAEALLTLSGLYENTNREKQALKAYKHYVALQDSILNDEKKAEITRKGLQFDFQKKEALLEAEQDKNQALATAEIKRQKLLKNASLISAALLLAGGFISFIFYRAKQRAVKQKQEAEIEAFVLESELKALRAQMNPHFIFNSLNSISNFILKHDARTADRFLTKFARLMRMTLENLDQKEVSLADDLKALELYMQLEMLRLNKAFSYEIKVDERIDTENVLIPPLILQPFVENSIWHGLAKKEGKGKILIQLKTEGDMISCIIEDNGIGREKAAFVENLGRQENKKSLGMKITNARIDIINKIKNSNAEIAVADLAEGFQVTVKLPLVLNYY